MRWGWRSRGRRGLAGLAGLAKVAVLAVVLAACCTGADDGAAVRSASGVRASSGAVGPAPGAASGSVAAPASGPPRPGSASASAIAPAGSRRGEARPPAGQLAAGACRIGGSTDETPVAAVEVEIGTYTMRTIPSTVPAGPVQVVAYNGGTRPHSVVIVRWDEASGDLPLDANGAVDIHQLPGDDVVAEISEFPVHGTCATAVDLEPGTYALFCYIVEGDDGDEHWAHYGRGTTTTLTVQAVG